MVIAMRLDRLSDGRQELRGGRLPRLGGARGVELPARRPRPGPGVGVDDVPPRVRATDRRAARHPGHGHPDRPAARRLLHGRHVPPRAPPPGRGDHLLQPVEADARPDDHPAAETGPGPLTGAAAGAGWRPARSRMVSSCLRSMTKCTGSRRRSTTHDPAGGSGNARPEANDEPRLPISHRAQHERPGAAVGQGAGLRLRQHDRRVADGRHERATGVDGHDREPGRGPALAGAARSWSPTASACHSGSSRSALWMSRPNRFSSQS